MISPMLLCGPRFLKLLMRAPGSSLCHRPFSRARFQRRHPGPRPVRTKAWPRGFPWLGNANKQKVAEANFFVDKCIEACERAANSNGFFILEHPEDLGVVDDEHPGSIWQWQEILELIPKCNACCFAIHQCRFGAITPKPTRLLTNLHVSDSRCHMSLPKFDRLGFLQRATATEMWPPSFTYVDWEDWH